LSSACVTIVDPFSAGALLAEALTARGARCIAVISSRYLPESMRSRFDPDLFLDIVQHSGDLSSTLSALTSREPSHVIAGCESGVELAEQLAGQLGLPGNDAALGHVRRDKFLMTEAVSARGMRTARQLQFRDADHVVDRVRNTFELPVILKPTRSTGSDLVFCCESIDAVAVAARQILSRNNVLGQRNDSVLVQEFLDGIEYVVDTVSLDGKRKTTAFWQYHRPSVPGRFVAYDAMTLLPYTGDIQEALQSYAYDTLDALSIQFGPAHCELMWVDNEPVLIEVGARLTGGMNAVLSGICGGFSQLDETVEAILSPDCFRQSIHDRRSLGRRAANVFLIPAHTGRLFAVNGLARIEQLPTLHSMSVSARPGAELKKVAGSVLLVDEDITAIERDIDMIRRIERDGLFELEAPR
jgi:biotin carboxylase